MKNEKKVMLLSLTILAVLLTGFTWAYWQNSIILEPESIKGESNTITIGKSDETQEIKTELITSSDDKGVEVQLLPNSVDQSRSTKNMKYKVEWKPEENLDSTKLKDNITRTVYVENFHIGFKAEGSNEFVSFSDSFKKEIEKMFEVQYKTVSLSNYEKVDDKFNIGEITLDTPIDFDLKINFKEEPENKGVYDMIAGKTLMIKFDVKMEMEQ